jgi:putative solute:sodium symporter small subunit
MAAQGSEIIFVITLFCFVRAQHNIDRDGGFADED